jgi:hypothetical protein
MTIWFRWAFTGEPERIDPPARLLALASAGALDRNAGGRIAVHGPFAGSWVLVQPPSPDFRKRLSGIMALRHGMQSAQDGRWYLIATAKLILDELVIDHDFVGNDGAALPVGEGFCQSLGHIDIAVALVRQIGKRLPSLL